MVLRAQLFGKFRVWRGTTLIADKDWLSSTNRSLFVILFIERGARLSQERLSDLLWPEASSAAAPASLRKRISELRHILEPDLQKGAQSHYVLTEHPGMYFFNPEYPCFSDLDAALAHYEHGNYLQGKRLFAKALQEYTAAAAVWRQEFLVEARYEEWAIPHRDKQRNLYSDFLLRLSECYAQLEQYQQAAAACRQAVEQRPLREELWRRLMLCEYRSGRRIDALRAYSKLRAQLQDELGIEEPSSAVKELYEQIRSDRLPKPDRQTAIDHAVAADSQLEQIPFIGREKECAHLVSYFERAGAGQGRMLFLSGEAGVGKTRLAQEICRYARNSGSLALEGRCHETGSPYEALVSAIRNAVPYLNIDDLRSVPSPQVAACAHLVPQLRNLAPRLPNSPPLAPEQQRTRLFEGLSQLLRGLAGSTNFSPPLVLFLDDLHWAGRSMFDLLRYLLNRLKDAPILVLAAYRDEEIENDHPVWELKRDEAVASYMHLSPLPYEALDRIVTAISPSLGLNLRRHLYHATNGNPLFLWHNLRNILDARKDWTGTDQYGVVPSLPQQITSSLDDLLKRRIHRFAEQERRALQLMAVIGEPVDPHFLAQTMGDRPDEVHDLLKRAIETQLLAMEADGRYRFSHERIGEIIYRSIGQEKQVWHRQVAKRLEGMYFARLEGYGATLAFHYYRAGEWREATEYAQSALEKAADEYRNHEALQLAELGLAAATELERCGEEAAAFSREKRFAILAKRVALYDMLGKREEQGKDIADLFLIVEQLPDALKQAAAHEHKGKWYLVTGENQRALEETTHALALRRRAKDTHGEGRALNALGGIYRDFGEMEEARRCHQQAYEILEQVGDKKGQASSINNLGVCSRRLNDYQQALDCFEEAYKMHKEAGNQQKEAQTLANIGNVWRELGKPQQSLHHYEQSLEIFRMIGDRRSEGISLFNKGIIYSNTGDYEKTLACYEAAAAIFRELLDKEGTGLILGDTGLLYAELGDYARALDHLNRAREIFNTTKNSYRLGITLHNLGNLHLRLGKHQKALKYFQKAYQIRQKLGDERRQGLDLGGIGAAYLDLGEHRSAQEYLDKALAIVSRLNIEHVKAELLSCKSRCCLGLQDRLGALQLSREAISILEQAEQGVIERAEEVYFTHYLVLQADEQEEQATKYLERAHGELMGKVEKVRDSAVRESFISDVKSNKQIIMEWNKIKDKSNR